MDGAYLIQETIYSVLTISVIPKTPNLIWLLKNGMSGARLTKACGVTIERCHNTHAKIEDSNIHI